MTRTTTRSKGRLHGAQAPAELVPAVLLWHTVKARSRRVRSAARRREAGAISTELALVVIALVALAGIVLAAITALGKRTAAKVTGL
ncbi:hypothetical protein BIV57_21510 [Mangrovactinospora gilvigrisea]|uniref:Uncharacterized protein n=1 Tax=Mangrovactinospora gilvigrisea TaxID=1428644 RepID=A0A1J7B9U1_9ACTN|nr:hypothetical protein [Mangrovactinospora gilvigrisea]OIV35447.1 hypothetical protein BIV57_21510 [Mangrovactinospora gilvigrisea]